MGDDDGGTIRQEPRQGALNFQFRVAVDTGRRLVQNQDGGIGDQRSGEDDLDRFVCSP